MARDTGRYDAITQTWIDQNVKIDFAWGNIPIQPNDDRGAAVLDPVLDSHEITYLGWNGFPEFVPNTAGGNAGSGSGGSGSGGGTTLVNVPQPSGLMPYDTYVNLLTSAGLVPSYNTGISNSLGQEFDWTVVPNSVVPSWPVAPGTQINFTVYGNYAPLATVPDISNLPWPAANAAIEGAGFSVGNTSGQTLEGATSQNTNWVATQTPAAGSQAPLGSTIDYVTYGYLSEATTGPISGFNRSPNPLLSWGLNGGQVVMYLTGRETWPTVGSTITISGTSNSTYNQTADVLEVAYDDSYNTGGVAVKLEFMNPYSGDTSQNGTWAIASAMYTIPNLVGMTESSAISALQAVGLVGTNSGMPQGAGSGATPQNAGTVHSFNGNVGDVLPPGTEVFFHLYAYAAPSGTTILSSDAWAIESGSFIYFQNVNDQDAYIPQLLDGITARVCYAEWTGGAAPWLWGAELVTISGVSCLKVSLNGNPGIYANTVGPNWTLPIFDSPDIGTGTWSIKAG